MALVSDLIEQLKQELKTHSLTYKDVASSLDLSEASIKRLFRERDMTLSRLETICGLIDLDISGLAVRADEARRRVKELSLEQEATLVSDEELFLLAVHLVYGWEFDLVMSTYELDRHKAQQHLTLLDRMKVIELLPENRVRILLSPDFEWIKDGPIQQYYEETLQGFFFNSKFSKPGELRLVVNGWMSLESITAFHDNMRRLVREFDTQKREDKNTPDDKRRGTTLVMAIRPWVVEIFEKYRRKESG